MIRSLLLIILLGTAGRVEAQLGAAALEPNPAPAAVPVPDAQVDQEGTLQLPAGPLPEVILRLERAIPLLPSQPGHVWTMPNVILDEATRAREAVVPAPLRLRKVSPEQALALIAAAAGCRMEPVLGPDPEPAGYKITRPGAAARGRDLVGIGISLVEKDGQTHIGEVYPDTPAARSPHMKAGHRIVSVGSPGSPPTAVEGMSTAQVAQLLRGYEGTAVYLQLQEREDGPVINVPLVREKLSVRSPANASNPLTTIANLQVAPGASNPFDAVPVSPNPDQPARVGMSNAGPSGQPPQLAVRVYAAGVIYSGTEVEKAEKEKAFREVFYEAMDRSEVGKDDRPNVSFHRDSKTLIVKGNAASHSLVEQILTAMKENETQFSRRPVQR